MLLFSLVHTKACRVSLLRIPESDLFLGFLHNATWHDTGKWTHGSLGKMYPGPTDTCSVRESMWQRSDQREGMTLNCVSSSWVLSLWEHVGILIPGLRGPPQQMAPFAEIL